MSNGAQPTHTATRVWLLTASMGAVAAVGWGTWGLHQSPSTAPFGVSWLVVLVGFAVAEILLVHFEFRGQAQALTLGEVPLIIGLLFCSPEGVLVARLGGSAIALVFYFRQSREKLGFNLAMHALKVLAALAVYHVALGDASPISAHGWAAAYLAAASADLVSHVAILAVITATAGRPSRAALAPMALTCVITAFTNSSLALITAVVVWHQPSAVWLLAVVAGVYATGYRAHSAIRRRYANLDRLYRFTHALSGAVTERDVIDAVLRESAELLRAERAALTVTVGPMVRRYYRDHDGVLHSEWTEAVDVERHVLDTSRSLLVAQRPRGGARPATLGAQFRDVIAVPVTVDDDTAAVLVVADRASEVSTFDAGDLRLFETLANHAAVALHGGQLLERLRDEVAAKEHQALHDHLTGLANRALFAQRVSESLAGPHSDCTTVMLMDLDRFKEINDTLGHHTGDMVLRHVAARLVHVAGDRGTVARLGGDEFAVVCEQPLGTRAAIAFAEELRAAAESPVAVDEMVLEAQASVGITMAPLHGTDAATLLQRADVAMYSAKQHHQGVAVYDPSSDNYTARHLSLMAELRLALAADGLELYYQPQVDMRDGEVRTVEALLRWNHPTHGFIPPDEFIPVAEHSGLMARLTSWVIDTALRQQQAWRAAGLDLSVAVNVSARSLMDPNLVAEVESLLRLHGVAADRLVLEVTETGVMTDMARGIDVLHGLAATGCHLSVDDFGTGYSSLSRLARLPVDEVKIDRSFVMGMTSDTSNALIVRSTIDLAHALGLRVVAEGVEDQAAYHALVALDCDVAQGYLLSRPLPAEAIHSWLSEWTPASRTLKLAAERARPPLRLVAGGE
jgi:diguanylate cyclase (GGDEF)-like protein